MYIAVKCMVVLFVISKHTMSEELEYCTKFLKCRMENVVFYRRCMEEVRAITGNPCAVNDDFKMLWNVVMQREADYALCVAHENLMTEDAQLKIAELRCSRLSFKKGSARNENSCWQKMDTLKKQCNEYRVCCPAAMQCQRIPSQVKYMAAMRQKHLEINRKTLQCRTKLRRLFSEKFNAQDHNKSRIPSWFTYSVAASNLGDIVAGSVEEFADIIKFKDKAIVHTNFLYPATSRNELHHAELSNNQRNLTMRHDFLKTIIAKLAKKMNPNLKRGNPANGSSDNAEVNYDQTIERLLYDYLYKLVLPNFMQENSTVVSNQVMNEVDTADFMQTDSAATELPGSKNIESGGIVDMKVRVRPSVAVAANQTLKTTELNHSLPVRIHGNTTTMWASTVRNAFEEYPDVAPSDEMEGGKNALITDIMPPFQQEIDAEVEVRPAEIAEEEDSIYDESVENNNFIAELPLKQPARRSRPLLEIVTLDAPESILKEAASREKDEKLLQTLDFSSNIDHRHKKFKSQEYDFKFQPKAIPLRSPSGETVTLLKHPVHLIDKYHKNLGTTTQENFSHQAPLINSTKQNLLLIRNEVDDEDFYPSYPINATQNSRNWNIASNAFPAEFVQRGEGRSSAPSSWRSMSSRESADTLQDISETLRPTKLKMLKHDIGNYAVARRRRFPIKKHGKIHNDNERKRSMLVEEEMKRNVQAMGKSQMNDGYDRERAPDEAYVDINGIWTVTPPTDRSIASSTKHRKTTKSDIKSRILRKIDIKLKESHMSKYKTAPKNSKTGSFNIVYQSEKTRKPALNTPKTNSHNGIITELERELAAIQANDHSTTFLRTTTEESMKTVQIPAKLDIVRDEDAAFAVVDEVPLYTLGSNVRRKNARKSKSTTATFRSPIKQKLVLDEKPDDGMNPGRLKQRLGKIYARPFQHPVPLKFSNKQNVSNSASVMIPRKIAKVVNVSNVHNKHLLKKAPTANEQNFAK